MDSLNYNYYAGKNQLSSVRDVVASAAFSNDIDNQPPNNYIYDLTGNLIYDASEKIKIRWTHYGKIKQIDSTAGTTKLKFKYDATGNRLVKENIKTNSKEIYVRDAQGHVIALYTIKNDSLYLSEMYMYGSQRLGYTDENIFLAKKNSIFSSGNFSTLKKVSSPKNVNYTFGNKRYEINDWLGNVRAVITDKKIPDSYSGNFVTSYKPEVASSTDYFPFGMEIAERTYSTSQYRYGFNGKEKDDEIVTNGRDYDYGARMYDADLGIFMSVDPLTRKFPMLTPYQFGSNRPIDGVDLDGREWVRFNVIVDNTGKVLSFTKDDYTKTEIKVGPLGGGIQIVKNLPNGEFVSSEFTPSADNNINKNLGFDVYTGNFNPKDYDFKTGKVIDSYAPQPADVEDKRTETHDKRYGEAGASGPSDAFGNYSDKVLAADKELAGSSLDIAGYYLVGKLSGNTPTDIKTGKPITIGTATKALVVGSLFGVISGYKSVANFLFGGGSSTPAPAVTPSAPAQAIPSGGDTDNSKKKSGG